jgi:hypothetical protein
MTQTSPETASVRFGFASYKGGKFELIAINIKTGEEITLEGQLRPDQTLEQIDKVLPTCVYVNGLAQTPLRSAAERVCWFDWSDNDPDAAAAIDVLRKTLADTSTDREGK